jgi:hypothetical protein
LHPIESRDSKRSSQTGNSPRCLNISKYPAKQNLNIKISSKYHPSVIQMSWKVWIWWIHCLGVNQGPLHVPQNHRGIGGVAVLKIW